MLGRWFMFLVMYALVAFPLGYLTVQSESSMPWTIAFFSYGALGGWIGNSYVSYSIETGKAFVWLLLSGATAFIVTAGYVLFVQRGVII